LHTVRYSLKKTYGADLYRKIAEAIENLLLAPYQVETFRQELVRARKGWARQLSLFEPEESQEGAVRRLQDALGWTQEEAREFLMTVGRQTALAHIMRVLYLKRLESSVEALRVSLRRLYQFLEMFLAALEGGRLLSSTEYRRWLQTEGLDDIGTEEADWEEFLASLPELPVDRYDVERLRAAVQADLHSLRGILADLDSDRSDDKLETLKELLQSEPLRGRKIVVFSYFKDTARYLYHQLAGDPNLTTAGFSSVEIVDSEVKPSERTAHIRRFAPRANGEPDMPPEEQINLLISTDVLSEGQNLQDADVIINYDLHWNPVRMVQRVGRLDRIGSPHAVIHVYNFFPEEELEDLLGLLERLSQKLDAINRTVGLDASILGEKPNPMDFNILRRLEQEDLTTFQELEAESELTVGEFLQQDLLRFLKEVGEEKLKRIPSGVGTARKTVRGPRGFFAAFRNPQTGQHHWLFYDEEKDRIIERRLEAIRHIRCEPSEPPEPLPPGFDPRSSIGKLRRHLWNRMRGVRLRPQVLPSPQRQIVNWLHALPPSAERNRLLQYFAVRPLTGPDLKELRRLWRERSTLPSTEWMVRLTEFAAGHPHPSLVSDQTLDSVVPENEEDLECIAWMAVL
jgi:superfamily II DNA or RNA helicase